MLCKVPPRGGWCGHAPNGPVHASLPNLNNLPALCAAQRCSARPEHFANPQRVAELLAAMATAGAPELPELLDAQAPRPAQAVSPQTTGPRLSALQWIGVVLFGLLASHLHLQQAGRRGPEHRFRDTLVMAVRSAAAMACGLAAAGATLWLMVTPGEVRSMGQLIVVLLAAATAFWTTGFAVIALLRRWP